MTLEIRIFLNISETDTNSDKSAKRHLKYGSREVNQRNTETPIKEKLFIKAIQLLKVAFIRIIDCSYVCIKKKQLTVCVCA